MPEGQLSRSSAYEVESGQGTTPTSGKNKGRRTSAKQVFKEALKDMAHTMGMASTERITGHTMRVTGAQDMLKAGFELEQIKQKMFGRWQSLLQLFKYLRGAAMANIGQKPAPTHFCIWRR